MQGQTFHYMYVSYLEIHFFQYFGSGILESVAIKTLSKNIHEKKCSSAMYFLILLQISYILILLLDIENKYFNIHVGPYIYGPYNNCSFVL